MPIIVGSSTVSSDCMVTEAYSPSRKLREQDLHAEVADLRCGERAEAVGEASDLLDDQVTASVRPLEMPSVSIAQVSVSASIELPRIVLSALAAASVRAAPRRVLRMPLVVDVESAEQGLTPWGRACGHVLLLGERLRSAPPANRTERSGVQVRG